MTTIYIYIDRYICVWKIKETVWKSERIYILWSLLEKSRNRLHRDVQRLREQRPHAEKNEHEMGEWSKFIFEKVAWGLEKNAYIFYVGGEPHFFTFFISFFLSLFIYLFIFFHAFIYLYVIWREREERDLSLSFSFSPHLSLFLPLSLSLFLSRFPSFLPSFLACLLAFFLPSFLPSFFFDFCLSFSLRLALHPWPFLLRQVVSCSNGSVFLLALSGHFACACRTRDGPGKLFKPSAPPQKKTFIHQPIFEPRRPASTIFCLACWAFTFPSTGPICSKSALQTRKNNPARGHPKPNKPMSFGIFAPFVLASSTLAPCQQLRYWLRVHVGLFSRFPWLRLFWCPRPCEWQT